MTDAYDHAACGLLTTSTTGAITSTNHTLCAWLGYSTEELSSRKFQDVLTVGSKLFHHTQWMPLLQLQGSLAEVQLELVTKDGRVVPVLVNAANRAGSSGDVDIAVFVASDRRKYERALLEERRRAEALLVRERAALETAASAVRRLELKNAELDSFAYVASHDLKAPLRGIANVVAWLREDEAPRLSTEGRAHLDLVEGRVEHLNALIDGILQFARAGEGASDTTDVSVRELLEQIVAVLPVPATTRIELPDTLPTLRCSRVALEQVLLNLLSNALKHAAHADAVVRVEALETGGVWRFAVRDDGPGIAPHHHDRVWKLFQALDPPAAGGSTGIGLAIVRKIVEGRGGQVGVESQLGQGATFFFTWPAHATV